MYQIVVERSAEKDLKKLPSEVRPRAIKAIQALARAHVLLAAANSQAPRGTLAYPGW